ncbi:MAG: hypothetical protein MPJ78_05740 [Hyphomicrobiaceae bacterium]|nr:hypothetical protein [Hyphomicrobiaceae bacterium]
MVFFLLFQENLRLESRDSIGGVSLAITATIRHCILLFTLAVAAAVFFSGDNARAGFGKPQQEFGQSGDIQAAKPAIYTANAANKPCKRPKAHAHHGCRVCHEHMIVGPVSRTRPTLPASKTKLTSANTLADRLAQAAAQSSARLILAADAFQVSRPVAAGVIAQTARIRN